MGDLMRIKRLLLLMLIIAITLTSIGCVSAGFFDFLNQGTVETIGGVNFTIPNGFSEDADAGFSMNDSDLNTTTKHYNNENFDYIEISVENYAPSMYPAYIFKDNGTEKNVSDKYGYYFEGNGSYLFEYFDSEYTHVLISSNNGKLLNETIEGLIQ